MTTIGVLGGRIVQYVETDVVQWAATGHGALDTNLREARGSARG